MIETLSIDLADAQGVQGRVSVSPDRRDGDRWRYRYRVTIPDGTVLAEADDLFSGASEYPTPLPVMAATLLGFLEAAAESYATWMRTDVFGENYHLFPPRCVEWAYGMGDELAMAREELGEEER